MANLYGPRIVTNGLVLCLDAGNNKSYPGSGTTWTDLSGNSNNGTLTNGPAYSSSNKGSIVFDGTNDYINLGTNYFISTGSPFSILLWFKPDVSISTRFHRFLTLRASGATTLGIGYAPTPVSGYNGIYIVNNSGWLKMTTSYTITSNIWALLSLTYNGLGSTNSNNFKMYWNTSSINLSSAVGGGNTTTDDNNFIGTRTFTADAQAYVGSVSNLLIYNTLLSFQNIVSNYNATKGRFV